MLEGWNKRALHIVTTGERCIRNTVFRYLRRLCFLRVGTFIAVWAGGTCATTWVDRHSGRVCSSRYGAYSRGVLRHAPLGLNAA